MEQLLWKLLFDDGTELFYEPGTRKLAYRQLVTTIFDHEVIKQFIRADIALGKETEPLVIKFRASETDGSLALTGKAFFCGAPVENSIREMIRAYEMGKYERAGGSLREHLTESGY